MNVKRRLASSANDTVMYMIPLGWILLLGTACSSYESKNEGRNKDKLAHPGIKKAPKDNKIRSQQKSVYTICVGSKGL